MGEARRAVADLGSRLGLSEESVGKLALIATELGTNLIKHGGGGEIIFRSLNSGSAGMEILALDKGPGISDWNRMSGDGYSTTGTSGNGLGAVIRLSTEHYVYALPQRGTIISARVRNPGISLEEADFELGAICLPIHGEKACGDTWAVLPRRTGIRVVVADGLGHGPLAAEASQAAIQVAREFPDLALPTLLEKMYEALRSTLRGAAVSIAEIDRQSGMVRYCGAGNVSGAIAPDGVLRQMVSHNGTVGQQMRRLQEFTYPWTSSSILVMHSDGLNTRWALEGYPGLSARHMSIARCRAVSGFSRGRDDATVLTLRQKPATR